MVFLPRGLEFNSPSKYHTRQHVFRGTLTSNTYRHSSMADKKSQRVAWGIEGRKRPIVETGLSNLTQDAAPVLIHFANGQTQQWLMVRLEEPKPNSEAIRGVHPPGRA